MSLNLNDIACKLAERVKSLESERDQLQQRVSQLTADLAASRNSLAVANAELKKLRAKPPVGDPNLFPLGSDTPGCPVQHEGS